jgi:hypothetical protein
MVCRILAPRQAAITTIFQRSYSSELCLEQLNILLNMSRDGRGGETSVEERKNLQNSLYCTNRASSLCRCIEIGRASIPSDALADDLQICKWHVAFKGGGMGRAWEQQAGSHNVKFHGDFFFLQKIDMQKCTSFARI